MARVKGIT